MFQPVRAFFQSEPLKNTFLECLHTIYVEGTHTKTLNFESGPASDNNLESGKVTRGHRNLISWWKKVSRNVFKLALQLFHLCKHKSISKISKNDKEHEKNFSGLRQVRFLLSSRYEKRKPKPKLMNWGIGSSTNETYKYESSRLESVAWCLGEVEWAKQSNVKCAAIFQQ